jgi:hypothetical protein
MEISESAMKPVNTSESWPALSADREMENKSLAYLFNKFVFVFGCHLIYQCPILCDKSELILKDHSNAKDCLSVSIHSCCRIEPKPHADFVNDLNPFRLDLQPQLYPRRTLHINFFFWLMLYPMIHLAYCLPTESSHIRSQHGRRGKDGESRKQLKQ